MKSNLVKSVLKNLALGILLLMVESCQQDNYKEHVSMESVDISENYQSIEDEKDELISKPSLDNPALKNLKIIKSANTKYKVKDVKLATKRIKEIALKYNAYISDLRFQNDLYTIENRFTIKIPQQYFDTMMDSIAEVAEFIDYENITTKDVTEEYVDLQTRLKTKLEVKERYEEIFRKNAKTVKDILAIEEKLRIIQEEIESAQGRLKYLTNKVSFSTIQIDLYETVDYKEEPTSYNKTFWSKTKNGFSFGWDLVEGIVLGVIYIWPLIISGVLLFFFVKNRLRKKH